MKTKLMVTALAAGLVMGGANVSAEDADAGWKYTGQGVVYYQTADGWGNGALFDQGGSGDDHTGWAAAAAGIQLGATNTSIIGGLGAGFELSGISSLGLEEDVVSGLVQNAGGLNNAAITQAYLTFSSGKTSMKWGRQQLPKSLSPFAFSEGWNVYQNTFEALLVVNSDIKDTTLVYAYVGKANNSVGDLTNFGDIHTAEGGANMITAQNTSVNGLTLTGSYYWIDNAIWSGGGYETDADALWVDASFKASKMISFGLQGGYIGGLSTDDDTNAFGAKVAGKVNNFSWSAAFSSVDAGSLPVSNIAGSGVKTPLYTQGVLNQDTIKFDSDTFRATVSTPAAGGTFIFGYSNSDLGASALPSTIGQGEGGEGTYQELDFMYKSKLAENIPYFLAFVNQNDDRQEDDSQNIFRVWVRYNF